MNKKIIILIIFLLVLAISGYFLYAKLISPFEVGTSLGVAKPLEIKFETEILAEPKFINLKQPISLPIKVDSRGKVNPFMKF